MKFKVRTLTGTEQLLGEVLAATRRPDGYAVMMLDLQAAEDFRKLRVRQTGVAISMLDMFVKAFANAAGRDEASNSLIYKNKAYLADSADIGISVASTTSVAPVVVIRGAEKLSLEEIHQRRVKLVQEALEQAAQREAELEKQAKLIPIPALRRRVLGWLVNQPGFRREKVGTLQISTIDLPDMEFYLPAHVATSLLLSVGGVKPRPMVVNGEVVPRVSANVAFMIDQRSIHPVRAMRLFRRFRRYIEHPEKLLLPPKDLPDSGE